MTAHPPRLLPVVLLACAASGAAPAFTGVRVDPPISAESDSLYRLDGGVQRTVVHVLEDSNATLYFAATMKTIAVPIDTIWQSLSGMAESKPKLKYFRDIDHVCRPDSSDCALYVEVGVAIARTWFLCDIDTIRDQESSRRTILFNQNRDPIINGYVRAYPHGWITVDFDQFIIEWRLEERGDQTHLGMFTVVDPDIWVPQWLFKIVVKHVYPSMLTSFEKYLLEKVAARRP